MFKGKPSSLLGLVISDEGKKFHNIDTWRVSLVSCEMANRHRSLCCFSCFSTCSSECMPKFWLKIDALKNPPIRLLHCAGQSLAPESLVTNQTIRLMFTKLHVNIIWLGRLYYKSVALCKLMGFCLYHFLVKDLKILGIFPSNFEVISLAIFLN